jgi:DNA phosphorothioation-dependent restriction protein DptF
MIESQLFEAFLHLSQHSVESVQNGMGFTDWDGYMHVDRPIEDKLMVKMDEIDSTGGGIIFLVGSAGDGKSHLISRIKQMSDWEEHCFYNDATASSSPKKTAIDTLKEALVPFKDANLGTTKEKLVLAINLGKLNSFIEDESVKGEYTEIVKATLPLFDDDATLPSETPRVKVVDFSVNKAFEFHPSNNTEYPVEASFMSSILEKVTEKSLSNPFYQAYLNDKAIEKKKKDPLLFNYELLSIAEVRHTICMTIIEAIIRCKLNITPREFLDFIYSIVVYPRYSDYDEKRDFYEALLPTLLYCGMENIIQRAISTLDPLKHSSMEHDKQLSVLFTSYSIPNDYLPSEIKLPEIMIQRTNEFYANNGRDIERTIKFVFRLNHLLSYHSEDSVYISYLSLLRGVFNKDIHVMQKMYDVVSKAIPRHYGSYYSKNNMVPLNIQGGRYRMFANLQLKPEPIVSNFLEEFPSEFLLRFDMKWKFPDGSITLRMDYQLYSYLFDLNKGKLALSYENEKDLSFSRFVRQLVEKCDCSDEITIIKSDSAVLKLTETAFGNIQLQ